MEGYQRHSGSKKKAQPRLLRLIAFFVLISFFLQAEMLPAKTAASNPPKPPMEKLLCQYGQWNTEYWDDTGGLSYYYAGNTTSTDSTTNPPAKKAEFTITKPTLLTTIVDAHVNPNTDATHVVEPTSAVGTLALVDDIGNTYGPFPAERGMVAVNNDQAAAEILWIASVDNVELAPGHYSVVDSEPSTALYNAQTSGVAATIVIGKDAAAYAGYMDALAAENEPVPNDSSTTAGTGEAPDNSGPKPEVVTYSSPKSVVTNLPDPNTPSYPGNNPSFPCTFVTDKPVMLMKIMDYHINNGKGDSPSLIGVQIHDGQWYGSWQAYGQAYEGIPNAIWVVTPNYEIPAGSYSVRDSTTSTLSADANSHALCQVQIGPVVSAPSDNITGKYSIGFTDDQGSSSDGAVILFVIDHQKTVDFTAMVGDTPIKFYGKVTDRDNKGLVKVTADITPFDNLKISVLMTFKLTENKYVITGRLNIHETVLNSTNGGNGVTDDGVDFSGSQISKMIPGYVPNPHAGMGKVGIIPGPETETQAVTGVALPTLAVLAAAAVAAASGGGSGGGGGHHSSSNDGGGESGDTGSNGGSSSSADDGQSGDSSESSSSASEGDSSYSGSSGGGGDSPGGTADSAGSDSPDMSSGYESGSSASPFDSSSSDSGLDNAYPEDIGSPINTSFAAPGSQAGVSAGMRIGGGLAASIPVEAAGALVGGAGMMGVNGNPEGSNPAAAVVPDTGNAAGTGTGTGPAAAPSTGIGTGISTGVSTGAGTGTGAGSPTSTGTGAGTNAGTNTGVGIDTKPESPPVAPEFQKSFDNLKTKLNEVNNKLKKENAYVMNTTQGIPLVETIETRGSQLWDATLGQFTGSKGLTCQGYVNATEATVREAVEKEFPGAKVDRVDFDEKSVLNSFTTDATWGDWFSSFSPQNHTYHKVTLPDKSEWAIDYQGANKNTVPVLRPNKEVLDEWTKRLGKDNISISKNVNLDIPDKK